MDKRLNKILNFVPYIQKKVISLLEFKNNVKILDIGCGTGAAIMYAAKLSNNNGEFYGIDLSYKMIEKAVEKSVEYKNVFFSNVNPEKMSFQSNFFDFIICNNSFHYYPNPVKVVNEIYRVLKVYGKVYISDPNADNNKIRAWDKIKKHREVGHVKFYNTKEYKTFFRNSNITYIESRLILFDKIRIGQKQTITVTWNG